MAGMFTTFFNFIESTTLTSVTSTVGTFASTINPLVGGFVSLYIVYLAYKALFQPADLPVMDAIKVIVSLSLCAFVAFNTTWYLAHVVPFVYHSGDTIATSLWGTSSSGASSIQILFDNEGAAISKLWQKADFGITSDNTTAVLCCLEIVLIVIGWTPFIIIATAYLTVAKIMVSLLLIIGPLFVMFAFFPSTRGMFQSWTGQCFNYMLLSIIYPLAFKCMNSALNSVVFSSGKMSFTNMLMLTVLMGAGVLVSLQIPTLCSTLSGGVGINSLVSQISQGIGTLARGGRAAYNGGKATYNGGKSVAKRLSDSGKNSVKAG